MGEWAGFLERVREDHGDALIKDTQLREPGVRLSFAGLGDYVALKGELLTGATATAPDCIAFVDAGEQLGVLLAELKGSAAKSRKARDQLQAGCNHADTLARGIPREVMRVRAVWVHGDGLRRVDRTWLLDHPCTFRGGDAPIRLVKRAGQAVSAQTLLESVGLTPA